MTFEELGRRIQGDQHALVDARTELVEQFGWKEDDARLTLLNKCSNVLIAVNLGVVFIDRYISKEGWWRENSTLPVDPEQMRSAGNEFVMLLRIALIHNFLYAIESSFRLYVRALDPEACSKGSAQFKSLYEWLLKRTGLQAYASLLDLWRNIRNTLHNNGLFVPLSGKDATVTYKGTTYDFRVGKPNDFVTTDLMVNLLPDMREFLVALLTSKEISTPARIAETS